jgi:hypothetical protein
MESYRMSKRYAPKMIVFCDNDDCEVKPMTDATNPIRAFADVEAWGYMPKASETTESARAEAEVL